MLNRDSRLRETTTKSGLGPTLTVTSSVELWTSTRELRNFRGCLPCKLKCRVGILAFERRGQSRDLDRHLKLLVQLCCGLRRENLEIFANAIHASIIEHRDTRFRETTTKSGLGPTFTVTSSVVLWTSTIELRNFRRCHPCKLKCRVGILGFERRRQSRFLDRTLQLLVQLCCGLRRENLEIFADAIHASINEQLIQIYDSVFGCGLKCRVGIVGFGRRQQIRTQMLYRDSRIQETTTKSGLDRPLLLLVQLGFGLRRENLEIFADTIHASINEQLIQIYNSFFDFSLKYRVGIVGLERRRQSTTQMQIRDTRFRETTTKYGLGPTFTVTSSVEHWTPTRELRNLRGCHPCKLKCYIGIVGFERRQQSRVLGRTLQLLVSVFGCGLKCRVGIVGFGRRQQIRVLERPLLLLVQLSFGLRRENLEIFADAIHANINEQLIQIYDGIFGFRLKCRVEILAFERGRQSRVLDRPLLLLVQLCFGLRRENLEVFADAIHASINEQLIQIYNSVFGCGLKCRVGIVGFGRRQQIRVLDRPLLLLVQLCFGLRRENLEIFADAIHASINEQLIQIYDGIFGFRLKCRVEILAFERGRQSRVLDRPLLLLDQLCFGLRRENLEIFADAIHANAIHASINEQLIQIYDGIFGFRLKCRVEILAFERGRQSRVLDRPFQLLLQMCFGLRRENLEIFVDAIHTSINEQLIQICNSVFGCRLKCRVGILGFERRRQSRVLDRPLQLLVQFCFGLRRENLEIFADAILASINEQLIQIYNSFFDFSLKYRVGIVGLERRQQSTVLDRPLQLLVQLLKCYIGIVGFERRQQSRVLDRTLHLLVQLSFGLRQESLEIFADAIHASINEQLIQMYDGIFGFRLKCRVGILDFERRRQSRVLDRPLQLLVQLSCGLRQDNLEIFANAIHASINEQLIQIYNSVFGCRLKCRVGRVGFGRRQQIRVLD
ncbi:hypothetical protein V1477_013523 [Vespula maculifrons]|uniref:Uncharacterized protein n=1 Tax=Vespula maculifrons TaxID=7453 RepID=A0ABD2BQF1_VESMC